MHHSIRELRKFIAPEIIFGTSSRTLAGQYCKNFHAKKALVVSDPGVIQTGWTDEVIESLLDAGINYRLFSNVSPNPREHEVMAGTSIYLEEKCDSIVAVGGGSPMDCAKGIGIVAANNGHILDYKGIDQISNPLPPLIFIPTTAGTSADVSQFAIIADTKELVKIAIVSKIIIPDVALIDPETTATMDQYLTACTGMDALVHAIEAFVSKASSPLTDVHALEAIRILSSNLPEVKLNPHSMEARKNIMFGSMEAGLAFSNSILGAVHAMSHSLGGFLDLPHGECNSMLLEHVINFNFNSHPNRFSVIAQNMAIDTRGMTTEEIRKKIFDEIKSLKKFLGITNTLKDTGVKTSDIPVLAQKALEDACLVTNPRSARKRDIEVIYEEAM
ncbi:MAG: iron-containing alcohol dehydrogenase [Desulfobacteraceae bacterium]|nr:iron-containing alcohol dehydrogenase [Desulfobacteraceae bacterium]